MTLVLALTAILRRLLDLVLLGLILTVLVSLTVARIVPAITGGPTYVVGGGSMEPTIPLGAVVVDVPIPTADLHVGDVVSVKVGAQQTVFTHRITRTIPRGGAVWIETKGDANPTPDPSIIPATSVAGRVSTVVPLLGYPIQLLSSLAGVAFLLSVGMVTLLGASLLETLEDDQRTSLHRRRLERAGIEPADLVASRGAMG